MALIRESLAQGHLLKVDPYAYTPTVRPLIDHEWGAGTIAYFATQWLGGRAILLLKFALAFATAFACVAPASCPSGDQLNCDGPDECAGTSTPVCCGVDVDNGTGQYPSCGVSSIGTSCKTSAECPTHLATSCTDTTTVVLCHEKADCSDPNNPVCCTFTEKTATITFCIDQNTANAAGATCHP